MKRVSLSLGLMLIAFVAGSLLVGPWSHGQPAGKAPVPAELTSYRDVVKPLLPAVVFIETYARNRKERLGLGSGFFIDPAGVIVTNGHVVEGAEIATVYLHDGRKFTSKNMRTDRRTDLAVILLDVKDAKFATLEFGNSEAMEIGDRVLAVGAPFGLAGSVTHGIISGKARSGLQLSMYEDFLQTDAAINPGNSGGPLVNLEGKVVGINAAIKSKTGGFQGVGLATSSNLAKNVVKALRTTGVVKRGYLGAHIRDLNADALIRLGLEKTGAVEIAEVFANTPAAKAGLKAGDIVTAISGRAVKNGDTLQRLIAQLPIDQAVDVDVLRGGKTLRLTGVISEQPATYGVPDAPPARPAGSPPGSVPPAPLALALTPLGIDVAEMTDALANQFGIRRLTAGVVITRIHAAGLASSSSLRPGTVITKIDTTPTPTPAAAALALQRADLSTGLILQVMTPKGDFSYLLMKSLR